MAGQHMLDIELAKGVEVRSAYSPEEEVPHSIALRKRNPKLKKALDEFIQRIYKSEFYKRYLHQVLQEPAFGATPVARAGGRCAQRKDISL